MAVVKTKPTSPGRRSMVKVTTPELWKGRPVATLTEAKKRGSGRNNLGHITTRHRGGGHKAHYRIVDFRRNKDGIPAEVERLEYDPNRSAHIALLLYADGERRYILAPVGVEVGDTLMSGPNAEIRTGNALPLDRIPLGSTVHNIELQPGKGGQMARSAGTSAQLLAREGDLATLRLPSGEVRMVRRECMATIGQVGNTDHGNIKLGKAGRSRWLRKRPSVRGSVMNPRDHPHGGGEGKSPVGMSSPKTPWGKPTMGRKTRGPKQSDKMIVRRRGKGRR